MKLPWWIIVVVIIIVYIIVSEQVSQNCLNRSCANGMEEILSTDTNKQIVDKIIEANRKNHEIVHWRRSMFASIIATIIISLLLFKRLPCGYDFFIIALYIFVVTTLSFSWFFAHWYRENDNKVIDSLLKLRHRF